jgi:hypothetical protein
MNDWNEKVVAVYINRIDKIVWHGVWKDAPDNIKALQGQSFNGINDCDIILMA